MFQKEVGGGVFRSFAFVWVIKAIDINGNAEKIYAYAFSKSKFNELKENVGIILNKLH